MNEVRSQEGATKLDITNAKNWAQIAEQNMNTLKTRLDRVIELQNWN